MRRTAVTCLLLMLACLLGADSAISDLCAEEDFEQEMDACINMLGQSTRSHVLKYSYEPKTSGLISVLQLALQMPSQLPTLCTNLRAYKTCQDLALHRRQSHWETCGWWQIKLGEYFYRFNGFFSGVCETNYVSFAHCISKQLDSYLAQRCNHMFSLRNRLRSTDECGLSNEYLGCLSALVRSGCDGKEADGAFKGVAPFVMGTSACKDRYDFAKPKYAFEYEPRCLSGFQEKLREIRSKFQEETTGIFQRDYPILISGMEHRLRTEICPSLQLYESRSSLVKSQCPAGYNLIQATFDWKVLVNQMELICDQADVYLRSIQCLRSASLRQCWSYEESLKKLMFNLWLIRCTHYYKQPNMDTLRSEWNATNRCLETAVSGQCGPAAGRVFGALAELQNTERRYEVNCEGEYQPLNYTNRQLARFPLLTAHATAEQPMMQQDAKYNQHLLLLQQPQQPPQRSPPLDEEAPNSAAAVTTAAAATAATVVAIVTRLA